MIIFMYLTVPYFVDDVLNNYNSLTIKPDIKVHQG